MTHKTDMQAALRAALELTRYAAAPFFSKKERKRDADKNVTYIYPTTEEWWDGLREQIESVQPFIEAALASRHDAQAYKSGAPVSRIKGVAIDGGYVIVTPKTREDAPAIKAAILDLQARAAAPQAEAAQGVPAIPVELSGVKDAIETGDGFWRSCSGCHETNEGCETGHYPYSTHLKCVLGAGCSECGGIGAVWDNTDYDALAAAGDADEIVRENAAPSPDREQVGETPEGCTPADAEMLRVANHSLAAENDYLRRRLRPFAQLASSPLSWAMVEYCIKDDPEKQTLQAPQMQRAFNRAADALREDVAEQPSERGAKGYSKEWCMRMAALEPDDGIPPAGIAASAPTLGEPVPLRDIRMLAGYAEGSKSPRMVNAFRRVMRWLDDAPAVAQPQAAEPKGMAEEQRKPSVGWKTWGENNDRCDHCCNGDRCDDPSHIPRRNCPYCLGTGDALWMLPQYASAKGE